MNAEILYRPAHAMARISLVAGESVIAETGAMVGMSTNVAIETSMRGGMLQGIGRLFGGESFFTNRFTAQRGAGELLVAQSVCGDMTILDVGDRDWLLQGSCFVAADVGVNVATELGGFRTFFAGEGLFVLRANGKGRLLAGAFGAIEPVVIDGSYVIDTGHLVAWDASLDFSVGKSADGWVASFLSGEGLVCHFRGHGTAYIQTRNPAAYGPAVGRLLPPRQG